MSAQGLSISGIDPPDSGQIKDENLEILQQLFQYSLNYFCRPTGVNDEREQVDTQSDAEESEFHVLSFPLRFQCAECVEATVCSSLL
jgi:hypothetical protein